jgi:pyridoxal phosphate enzyme (YggS family)
MSNVAANLQRVRDRIASAALRAGRQPADVSLVVVTKAVGMGPIEDALAAGAGVLGENRVQEAREKWAILRGRAALHLIGHLQTNKAGPAVEMFELIHSLDSLRLAEALDRRAAAIHKVQGVLIEVHTTNEASKHGVDPEALPELVDAVRGLSHLEVQGLMTMGPLEGGIEGARRSFALLRGLLERLASAGIPGRELSMGMTGDFEVAIEEGATIVRIGSAIFARA